MEKGRNQPLASPDIIDEFIKILSYPKFQLTEKDIDFLLNQEILPWFAVVSVKTGRSFVADDPDDDKFIWCALAGEAEFFISVDEHLPSLVPARFRSCRRLNSWPSVWKNANRNNAAS